MSTALDPRVESLYHHLTSMTKFGLVLLFSTALVVGCHPSAEKPAIAPVNPPESASKKTALSVTSRVLCLNSEQKLLTYPLSAQSRFPISSVLAITRPILAYRMLQSNGPRGELLVATLTDTDVNSVEIALVDYHFGEEKLHRTVIARVPRRNDSYFATSPDQDFALIAENHSYLLYDLKNRLTVRHFDLNPSVYAQPRLSENAEFALFSHGVVKQWQRQVLVSMVTGKATALPWQGPQSGILDAQFLGTTAVFWRETKTPHQLFALDLPTLESGKKAQAKVFAGIPEGPFIGSYDVNGSLLGIATATHLQILHISAETLQVLASESIAYPTQMSSDRISLQAAPWSNHFQLGFNSIGKSLSFHTQDQSWLIQNCLFPYLGPETIVEIPE